MKLTKFMRWEGNPERSRIFWRNPGMKFQANPVPKNPGILQNPVPEIPGLKILDPAGAWSG